MHQAKVPYDCNGPVSASVTVANSGKRQIRVLADVHFPILNGQRFPDGFVEGSALVFAYDHIGPDASRFSIRRVQHKVFRRGNAVHMHGVGERMGFLFFPFPGNVFSVLCRQLPLGEYSKGLFTVQIFYQLHIGNITGANRSQIGKAILTRRIQRGKPDGIDGIGAQPDGFPDHTVHMTGLQNIPGMDIIGTEGDEIGIAHPFDSLKGFLEKVGQGAGLHIDMHSGTQLLSALLRETAFVIADGAGGGVGLHVFSHHAGSMSLQEYITLQTFCQNIVHPLFIFYYIDIVHDFCNADHTGGIQQICNLFRMESSSASLQCRNGGDTGRGQNILAQRRIFGVFQHELHALNSHDIANLVRIGYDGGCPPWKDCPGKLLRDHHCTFHMHMRINETGDQVCTVSLISGFAFPVIGFSFFPDPDNHPVQNIHGSRIDLTGYDIQQPYIFDGQVAWDFSHGGCDQTASAFLLCNSQTVSPPIYENKKNK